MPKPSEHNKFTYFSCLYAAATCLVVYRFKKKCEESKKSDAETTHTPIQSFYPFLGFQAVKDRDLKVLLQLLGEQNFNTKQSLVINDIGGHDGSWSLKLLERLLQPGFELSLTVVEPDQEKIQTYERKITANDGNSSIKPESSRFFNKKLEELEGQSLETNKADMTLCSHSLYYSRRTWQDLTSPLGEHVFTNLLGSLNEGGKLCVILQSGDDSHVKSGTLINQRVEDFHYQNRPKNPYIHQNADNFANAEMFELALRQYKDILRKKTGIELSFEQRPSLTAVSTKDLCFTLDHKTQRYEQSRDAKAFLDFYSRGDFSKHDTTADKQREYLDFFGKYTKSGVRYSVVHVNMVFVISLSRALTQEDVDKLGRSSNVHAKELTCGTL